MAQPFSCMIRWRQSAKVGSRHCLKAHWTRDSLNLLGFLFPLSEEVGHAAAPWFASLETLFPSEDSTTLSLTGWSRVSIRGCCCFSATSDEGSVEEVVFTACTLNLLVEGEVSCRQLLACDVLLADAVTAVGLIVNLDGDVVAELLQGLTENLSKSTCIYSFKLWYVCALAEMKMTFFKKCNLVYAYLPDRVDGVESSSSNDESEWLDPDGLRMDLSLVGLPAPPYNLTKSDGSVGTLPADPAWLCPPRDPSEWWLKVKQL